MKPKVQINKLREHINKPKEPREQINKLRKWIIKLRDQINKSME